MGLNRSDKQNNRIVIFKLFILLCNFFAVVSYYYFLDIESRVLKWALLIAVALCIIGFLTVVMKSKYDEHMMNVHMSLFVVVVIACSFELMRIACPQYLPQAIKNYIVDERKSDGSNDIVEYLNKNPFVKVKPNVVARSSGYRGTESQFAYEWQADYRGFKNSPNVANASKYFAVAVGDSFTEGMGVNTDSIWTTLLSNDGYVTYNLGVQSYAASQYAGVLKQYGLALKPKYIIVGYTGGIHQREKMMWGTEEIASADDVKKYIKRNRGVSLLGEVREQAKYSTSALFLLVRYSWYNIAKMKDKYSSNRQKVLDSLAMYESEIHDVGKEYDTRRINEIALNAKEWNRVLDVFQEIKKMGKSINAKTIIVYFPHRAEIYYEKATGKMMPDVYYEKYESELLEKYCRENDLAFIDISDKLRSYVNKLDLNAAKDKYPYLELDGHMSKAGHRIVADAIEDYFKKIKE